MADYQAVFERHEKKYILSLAQYKRIRNFLHLYMEEGPFGNSTVCSLYFDTDAYDLIRKSIEKPVYKEKFRLRSYGTPHANSTVFLELKKKFKGVVYKRRISLPLYEAYHYLYSHIKPAEKSQIFEEIDWFYSRYTPTPKVLLCCDRVALHGKANPELRITFDFKIRWRDYDLALERGDYGTYLISPNMCLMEIKTADAIPMWLSRYLSENAIAPGPFSKYGTCYKNWLIDKGGRFYVG